MRKFINRRKPVLLIGPYFYHFNGKDLGIWLARTRFMIPNHAIVICTEGSKPIYFDDSVMPIENVHIFSPADLGIKTYKDFSMALFNFARWCLYNAITCIFIDGDFAQSRAKEAGYGFVRYDSSENEGVLHTMDLKKALQDPFLRGQFDSISL